MVSYFYFYNQVVGFRLPETMPLMQTTHKGGPVVPQWTKCLKNNNWIISLNIKLKSYSYSLEFFHLVHTCACKNISEVLSVPGWTPEVYSSVCKCNVADIMSLFFNHLLWTWHQFVLGWGMHTEWSPKGIVLDLPIVSMILNFTCRTFLYMTIYHFSFMTFNRTQNILVQFFTRWALAHFL